MLNAIAVTANANASVSLLRIIVLSPVSNLDHAKQKAFPPVAKAKAAQTFRNPML
jgi:hypothetical protein